MMIIITVLKICKHNTDHHSGWLLRRGIDIKHLWHGHRRQFVLWKQPPIWNHFRRRWKFDMWAHFDFYSWSLLLLFILFSYLHLMPGFRELHWPVCSNSLFRFWQRSHERRLWYQLPTVTLLDSSTPLPLPLSFLMNLFTVNSMTNQRTRRTQFWWNYNLKKLWYSEI